MRSMRIGKDALGDAEEIVLIDDVVTRGTMFLASASLLREAFPKIKIRAFALVRTMSGLEVAQIENPSVGKITPFLAHAERRP
jgi:adenine/guanine phosphoribosyltransferase-like PRPP-binding protein